MGKNKVRYVCTECGHVALKWMGRCPGCGSWNTLSEEVIAGTARRTETQLKVTPLSAVGEEGVSRFSSGFAELDRVLGGGIVPGSLVLVGGDPGIGKSTLLLQAAGHVASNGGIVLYLSGEESSYQVKMRASRLGIQGDSIYLLNEQNVDYLPQYLEETKPTMVIVDSIQTVFTEEVPSIPGSVGQLRECAARLMRLAKSSGTAFFLVGHVTKEGLLAGPKILEHLVDTVVYFEGGKEQALRILRAVKNRFGSTDEVGLLEMSGVGLIEVPDASRIFLGDHSNSASGSAVVAAIEGTRPLLVEVQALVVPSGQNYPRRMVSGFDQNRLSLIVAVLEKRCGIALSSCDVYVKVTGGVFLRDPSADLGLAAAIVSSFKEVPVPPDTVFIGEVGLSGEVRGVPALESRLREAARLGFVSAVIPGKSLKKIEGLKGLRLMSIGNLIEILEVVL